MSTASTLVDSFVKSEQAKTEQVCLAVGGGMHIFVTKELGLEAQARGVGTIVEPRKSLFGFEPR